MVASTSISRTRRRFGVTTSVVAAAAVAAAVLLVVATGSAVVNAPAKHTQISLWNTNIPIGVDAFVSTPPSTWTARAQQRDQIVSWQRKRHDLQARLQVVKEDIQSSTSSLASSTSTSTTSTSSFWLTLALQSPLWKYVLVPLAR